MLKGSYKNFFLLLGSSSLSQILVIIALPFLSTGYSKESFAYLSLFTAICASTYPIITGRLNYALIGEKNNDRADNIFNFALVYIFATSLIFIIIIQAVYFFLDLKIIHENFFASITFYIFFYSIFEIIISDINRIQNYNYLSAIKFLRISFLLLMYFYLIERFDGLILSQILSFAFLSIIYIFFKKIIFDKSLSQFFKIFKKYKAFIIENSIATSLNNFTLSVPIFYIGSIYGLEILGSYSLFNMIVFAPLSMISKSISQVNNGNLINLKNQKKRIRPYFNKTLISIFLCSLFIIPVFLVFNFFFFEIFFDLEKWSLSRDIINILIFGVIVQFGASSLSTTIESLRIVNRSSKVKYLMIVSSFIVHLFSYYFQLKFLDYILFLTIEKIFIYLIYYYQINMSVFDYDNTNKL